MSELTVSDILQHVRQRKSHTGLVTADRYFRAVEGCFDGGFCPVKIGAESEGQWKKALKDAEKKLTFTNKDQKVITKSIKASKSEDFILEFDGIITTPRRDRDGDVLETKGAQIDKDMPLLMHHMGMMPIGKRLRTLRRNSDELRFKLGVVDTALARDNIPLIKAGALRISHAFDPIEFDLMDDERGFLFSKFLIFETSLVSIPSNVDAVITNFSEKSFETTLMKGWYDGIRRQHGGRKKSVATVPDDLIDEEEAEEDETQDVSAEDVEPGDKGKSWDNRVVKDFDVERQHVEAARLEYDWISRFCSCEVKQLVNVGTESARIRMGSFLTGLNIALNDSKEVDARRLTRGGLETPLEYETIQLNSMSTDHFLVDGISFRKLRDGTCFAVKYTRLFGGERVEIFSSKKDHEKVAPFLGKAWKWADENNFLKGEAFSLRGEFINKSSESWGDVFLDPANEREVKKSVDLLNSKGKGCPNRGIVMMGPPGTGKTLSCRLMRNNADATFIWIGGKDAYLYGGIGSVLQAFELAKELSPSIVVMEDIDASLTSRYATDVLKTEMDGIGQSSGITTVMTTNHPGAFPKALLDRPGRFHDVLKFDLPDEDIRKRMLEKWLPDLDAKKRMKAVSETKGYSGAHLFELCQYAKNLREQDETDIDDAVVKALEKIAQQRDLIDEELTQGRRLAGRIREEEPEFVKCRKTVKSFGSKSFEPERSFSDIETEYIAELAKADTDVLRKAHRRVSLMLKSAEEREEAREWDEVLSLLT